MIKDQVIQALQTGLVESIEIIQHLNKELSGHEKTIILNKIEQLQQLLKYSNHVYDNLVDDGKLHNNHN